MPCYCGRTHYRQVAAASIRTLAALCESLAPAVLTVIGWGILTVVIGWMFVG